MHWIFFRRLVDKNYVHRRQMPRKKKIPEYVVEEIIDHRALPDGQVNLSLVIIAVMSSGLFSVSASGLFSE